MRTRRPATRPARLLAGTAGAVLLGATPLAVQAPAHADGQTFTPVISLELAVDEAPLEPPYMSGGAFHVTGEVTGPTDADHPGGGQALLQVRTASDPTWTTVATDDTPDVLFFDDLTFSENADLKVVFSGSTAASAFDDNYLPGESAPVEVEVTRKVVMTNPEGTVLAGRVTPDFGRKRVVVEKKVRGRWTAFRAYRTDRRGRFELTLPAPRRGKWYFRVSVPGTRTYAEWSTVVPTLYGRHVPGA